MAESAEPLTTDRLTDHAWLEMARRQIRAAEVGRVLAAPQPTECVREGRALYRSCVERGAPTTLSVLRVVVGIAREPAAVVTAYRSSKVQK